MIKCNANGVAHGDKHTKKHYPTLQSRNFKMETRKEGTQYQETRLVLVLKHIVEFLQAQRQKSAPN